MNHPEPSLRLSPFGRDLLEGLTATPKRIPAKYFYDQRGSILFEEICRLPEYYPTRVEIALLERHAPELAMLAGPFASVVEFGAGSLRKVEILLDALVAPSHYIPIDISGEFLRQRTACLRKARPRLSVLPVEADFTLHLTLPDISGDGRLIGFFPGSTIGNLDYDEAAQFLRRTRQQLSGGAMLVGVDLVKDPAVLHAAYNDSAGVTAAFNRNVLARAVREGIAELDPEAFAHYAYYDPRARRIEMHLVSLRRHTIRFAGRLIEFDEGETIHTENSYKYTIGDFQDLALDAGFVPAPVFTDDERLFSLHWLENPG